MRVKSNYMLVYHMDFALLMCAAFDLSLQPNCMNFVSKVYCYLGVSKMLELLLIVAVKS